MKEWKENHFELVLNILVIYLEIILHIMSCKIPAYLQKTQNSTPTGSQLYKDNNKSETPNISKSNTESMNLNAPIS
jgi:hypothetical protein